MWLWIVALATAVIWWSVNREGKGSGKSGGHGGRFGGGGGGGKGATAKRLLNFVLWLVGMTALMAAPLSGDGDTLASLLADLLRWLAEQFGLPGNAAAAVSEIFLWAGLIAAGYDLKGRKVDTVARSFIVVAPILAMVSTGPLGGGIESAISSLNGTSVEVVQDMAQ